MKRRNFLSRFAAAAFLGSGLASAQQTYSVNAQQAVSTVETHPTLPNPASASTGDAVGRLRIPVFRILADEPLTLEKVKSALKKHENDYSEVHNREEFQRLNSFPLLDFNPPEKGDLLDINVLLALVWPNHVDHKKTRSWFANRRGAFATCTETEFGFFCVSAQTEGASDETSFTRALRLLRLIYRKPGHVYWEDNGYTQPCDAHFLSLAVRQGGRLVTLDRSIRGKLDPESVANRHLIEL